jgi:alanine dehydrogenase
MEGLDIAGTKIVSVHPDNSQKGLPTVMATIFLNDPKTGALIAIMDGTYITNLRTGAAGGIAAKYLARKNSKVIGLVGTGAQAETQLLALQCGFKIESVKVFDQNQAKAKSFAEKMSKQLGIDVIVASSVQDVAEADIVCTTTPSREPIVMKEWIKPGTHINAMGADAAGKEELDPGILKMAKIVVDSWAQASHSGDINIPFAKGLIKQSDIYAELGEIVVGKKPGRVNEEEITVFDSTGLAIQDISTAKYVYDKNIHHRD